MLLIDFLVVLLRVVISVKVLAWEILCFLWCVSMEKFWSTWSWFIARVRKYFLKLHYWNFHQK